MATWRLYSEEVAQTLNRHYLGNRSMKAHNLIFGLHARTNVPSYIYRMPIGFVISYVSRYIAIPHMDNSQIYSGLTEYIKPHPNSRSSILPQLSKTATSPPHKSN